MAENLFKHSTHFNNVRDEIIKLVKDYLDQNCVEFKKEDEKNSFEIYIKNQFDAIKAKFENKITFDNNYSNSQSGQVTDGDKSVSNPSNTFSGV